jgi:hypothetical protein
MPRPFAALRRRLDRLEQKLLPAPPPLSPAEARRLRRDEARLDKLLQAVQPLLDPAEAAQVREALDLWDRDARGPFSTWFRDLTEGRSTLPSLTPEAMKAVLLAWLSPERDNLARVCRQCGLEYPDHKKPPVAEWKLLPGKRPLVGEPPWYDLPDFFAACPGCGASLRDFDWAHLMDGQDPPWKREDWKGGRR